MRTKRTFWLNISLLLIASLILASCAPAAAPLPAATEAPPAEPAATEPPTKPAATEAPTEPAATEEAAPPAAEPKVLKGAPHQRHRQPGSSVYRWLGR